MSKMPVGNSLLFLTPEPSPQIFNLPGDLVAHPFITLHTWPLSISHLNPTPLAALLRPLYAFLSLSRSGPELPATLRKARRTARGFSVPQGAKYSGQRSRSCQESAIASPCDKRWS